MKRLFCCIFLLPFFLFPVYAEVAEETGADDLWELLPDESVSLLSSLGISSVGDVSNQTFDTLSFLSALRPSFLRAVKRPVKTGAALLILLLLCTAVNHLTGTKITVGKTGAAVCALLLLATVTDTITRLSAVATATGTFLQGYVPIGAGLSVACGQPASATVSSAFLLSLCAALKTFADKGLLPLSGMLFALAAVTSFDTSPAAAFADLLFGVVKGALCVLAVLSATLFSLQHGIASVSDGLSLRSAKLAVQNFVPFVGKTLAEAVGTVAASASVIRTGVGVTVLLALLALLLPSLLELCCWQLSLRFLSFFAESCEETPAKRLLARSANVFSLLTAAACVTAALVLFATALLVKTGGNA